MSYRIITQHIDHYPVPEFSGYRLGRHVEHDSRSLSYAIGELPGDAVGPIRWQSHISILDQGDLGACTGFAAVGALGHSPYYETLAVGQPLDNSEGRAVYHSATTLDSIPGTYPPDDTGSTGNAAAKALKNLGLISGYKSAFTIDALKAGLQSGPMICGTNWYNSMFTPLDGLVHVDTSSGLAGGHEYVCDELTADGRFGFTNSWGPSWGQSGRFYISVAQYTQLFGEQGDAILFVPLTQPAPVPVPPSPAPAPTPVPPAPVPPAPRPLDPDVKTAYDALKRWASRNGL